MVIMHAATHTHAHFSTLVGLDDDEEDDAFLALQREFYVIVDEGGRSGEGYETSTITHLCERILIYIQ